MTVAEVADFLARRAPAGWAPAWLTEQELCDGAAAGWLPAGHLPEGVLELRSAAGGAVDGVVHRIAVEVELHEKQPGRYAATLAWYRRLLTAGALERVRWYVPDRRVGDAVLRALRAAGVFVGAQAEVRLIDPEEVTVYGSARLLIATASAEARPPTRGPAPP
jgi:hypothetical protein